METFWYLLLTLLLLSIMVVIHELGHFLFAKLFKVTVLEFSIGMGPAIFTTAKKKKSKSESESDLGDTFHSPISERKEENKEAESAVNTSVAPEDQKTVFSIRAFPIGGYVRMAGEDDSSDDANAFCNKKVWQRFLITVAGPVMNILLGIICMFTMVGIDCVNDGYLASNVVDSFFENATSDDYGLMEGDEIIRIDGIYVHTGQEVVYEILNNGYEPIDILVVRNGEKVLLEGVQFPTEETTGTTIGDRDFYVKAERITFGSIVKHSIFRSISTVKVIVDGIKDFITGRYGAEAVSGPVGMAGAVEDAVNIGFYSLLHLFTLITINLGVFNLLPLPALDGGRIIFLIIEMVRRKPLKKEIEATINTVGLLLLLGLMMFVTLKDVINLF